MKKTYKDFYGCFATITEKSDGRFELKMVIGANTAHPKTERKLFDTFRGAKMSMSRASDGWQEIVASASKPF